MIVPPVWLDTDLETQQQIAIAAFRDERMREPLDRYVLGFDQHQGDIDDLLEHLVDLADVDTLDDNAIVAVLTTPQFLDVFRYLSGPPISRDDLKTVADVKSLNPKVLKKNPAMARAVFQTVLAGLDTRRFPWVLQKREPSEKERHAAVVASAALMATQRTTTARRSEAKSAQEATVFRSLFESGFVVVQPRPIATLDDAPEPGEFCGESMLGGRKADIVVRLHDRRVLAVECKVSNSSTNSIKRLNNDAAVKAVAWLHEFGHRQLIPAAMLSGVFKLRNLLDAQTKGLTLWWAHDLARFKDWVSRATP